MVAQATQHYREVKRKANVGETVKVIEAKLAFGMYRKGDVLSVTSVDDNGVIVPVSGEEARLWHEEYVVLEPAYDDLIANLSAEVTRLSKRVATLESTQNVPVNSIKERYGAYKQARKTREDIVSKAKADVEDLKRFKYYDVEDVNAPNDPWRCKEEFIVNKEKRTVVALLKGVNSGKVYAKGIAKTAPSDCFNVHIGRAISLRRALGLEVPKEYTNCPKPTEVKVGDIIFYSKIYGVGIVVNDGECPKRVFDVSNVNKWIGYDSDGEWPLNEVTRVIDDSASYE